MDFKVGDLIISVPQGANSVYPKGICRITKVIIHLQLFQIKKYNYHFKNELNRACKYYSPNNLHYLLWSGDV